MTSDYENIYSRFLQKVTDYDFVKLDTDDAYAMMNDWIKQTAQKPFVRKLFSSISFDHDVMKVNYEMNESYSGDEEFSKEFVENMFASGMVVQWLEPRVKSVINISQMVSDKERQFYSQAQHLSQLKDMLQTEEENMRKLIRDYSYGILSMGGNQ